MLPTTTSRCRKVFSLKTLSAVFTIKDQSCALRLSPLSQSCQLSRSDPNSKKISRFPPEKRKRRLSGDQRLYVKKLPALMDVEESENKAKWTLRAQRRKNKSKTQSQLKKKKNHIFKLISWLVRASLHDFQIAEGSKAAFWSDQAVFCVSKQIAVTSH